MGAVPFDELLVSGTNNHSPGPPRQCRGNHEAHPGMHRTVSWSTVWMATPRSARPSSSASSSNPYDIARSLRYGQGILNPHSVGSMGSIDTSDAAYASEFWGAPSMSPGALVRAQPPSPTVGSRQSSINVRALSGSLYDAFYSGMDVMATPPMSVHRGTARRHGQDATVTMLHGRPSLGEDAERMCDLLRCCLLPPIFLYPGLVVSIACAVNAASSMAGSPQ
jgi:hypothetical protein